MSWSTKAVSNYRAKQKTRSIVDDIMADPRYQEARKRDYANARTEAFGMFLTLSVDYLERYCGFGKKRVYRFLDFINEQILTYSADYVPDDPESNFWDDKCKILLEELGVDVYEEVGANISERKGA